MKVLFAASECVPFVKTGGLADVVGALSKALVRQGVDARVILPLYREIPQTYRERMEHCLYFYVNLGWRRQYVGIEKLELGGVTFYFVDNLQYFDRPYIYGSGGDEGERFSYFCRAVMEAMPQIDFVPDILHCHDWQTGMIPALLEAQYRTLPLYRNVKTVFTIHNLRYQGVFPIHEIEEYLSLGDWAYDNAHLEFYGQCSFMKGGLVFADKITTVSPTYAQEIQTAYYGERLDGLLRSRVNDLSGVLNGIDTEEYDPQTDSAISVNYGPDTFAQKVQNKLALQRELGLQEGERIPLIGMVSRLSGQKGFDLVERVLDEILKTGAQLCVLGKGEDRFEDLFNWAQWKYPTQLAARIEMNHALAHKIYAGSDFFLMPSMFEPCGLSQMIALRYGSLPITRETGGLRDTVLSYNEFTGDGNGFTFLNYNAHDMLHVIERAVRLFQAEPETIEMLATRAMRGEYGWSKSAGEYVALYASLLGTATTSGAEESAAQEPAAEDGEAPQKSAAKKPAAAKKAAAASAPAKKPAARKKAAEGSDASKSAAKKPAAAKKAADASTPAKKPAARKKAAPASAEAEKVVPPADENA